MSLAPSALHWWDHKAHPRLNTLDIDSQITYRWGQGGTGACVSVKIKVRSVQISRNHIFFFLKIFSSGPRMEKSDLHSVMLERSKFPRTSETKFNFYFFQSKRFEIFTIYFPPILNYQNHSPACLIITWGQLQLYKPAMQLLERGKATAAKECTGEYWQRKKYS